MQQICTKAQLIINTTSEGDFLADDGSIFGVEQIGGHNDTFGCVQNGNAHVVVGASSQDFRCNYDIRPEINGINSLKSNLVTNL